jgi:cytochrome P450
MLNAKDPKTGQGFTERELWTESLLLLIAGMSAFLATASLYFKDVLSKT